MLSFTQGNQSTEGRFSNTITKNECLRNGVSESSGKLKTQCDH